MRDFKRASKLLWYKNRLAIALMGMFLILSFALYASSVSTRLESKIVTTYLDLKVMVDNNNYYDDFHKKGYKSIIEEDGAENIVKSSKEYTKEIAKKYNIDVEKLKDPEKVDEYYSEYFEKMNYEEDSQRGGAFYTVQNALSYIDLNTNEYKLDISEEVFGINIALIIFAVLLALFFSGLENITPYFEFTKMFPWTKNKTYGVKAINGVLLILAFSIIGALISYFTIINNKYFGSYFILKDSLRYVLSYFILPIGLFLIALSVGEISGNFLGNFGLFIIAILGLWLVEYNLATPFRYLGLDSISKIIFDIGESIREIKFLNVLLYPIYGMTDSIDKTISFGITSIIFFILGYLFMRISKNERNGLMILNNTFSKIIEIIAIITSVNLIGEVFQSVTNFSAIGTLIMYIVLIIINIIFWRRMFKIRIGI